MSCPPVPHHQGYGTPTQPSHANNQDEAITTGVGAQYIGNFHKTLPHNEYGEIKVPADYVHLRDALLAPQAAAPGLVDNVPRAFANSHGFVAPLTGRANERLMPQPDSLYMDPAPKVLGPSIAAELVELYWMALLRDISFAEFSTNSLVGSAIADISTAFQAAVDSDPNVDIGKLQTKTDVPEGAPGKVDIRLETLFRCGLPGENKGPIVSQFFLKNFRYGAQYIDQRVQPYASTGNDVSKDYLITHDDWLDAQNRGRDRRGQGYGSSRPVLEPFARPMLTMRDLATFVNQDALHQAYFNAALILLGDGYAVGDGNPYPDPALRQVGFGAFGGPHLLTLVSEVAARALKVVWYQKWQVHRRLRPEAYAGLVQMELNGHNGVKRPYGTSAVVHASAALQRVMGATGTAFLPMPFPSGSPVHPAYGAGHATVAGACVTVVKAWFKDAPIKNPVSLVSTRDYPLWSDVFHPNLTLPAYTGNDLTVHGELNKIACNVSMGRSMGGVHFRSDNVRSLRLGERAAIVFLARELNDFIDERHGGSDPFFTFVSFDGNNVQILPGKVFVNGAHDPSFDPWMA